MILHKIRIPIGILCKLSKIDWISTLRCFLTNIKFFSKACTTSLSSILSKGVLKIYLNSIVILYSDFMIIPNSAVFDSSLFRGLFSSLSPRCFFPLNFGTTKTHSIFVRMNAYKFLQALQKVELPC